VVPLLALILLFAVMGGMYYAGRQVLRKLFSRGDKASL